MMIVNVTRAFLLVSLLLVSCSAGDKASAVVPVDFSGEETISNQDFDLTILAVVPLEEKMLGKTRVKVKNALKDSYTLYEIRTRYTNIGDEPGMLSYKRLNVSVPEVEDSSESLAFVGYCEPKGDNPGGPADYCAYQPPIKPGVYGVTGVYQFGAEPLEIQPGEQANFSLFIILENTQPEIQVSFVEPQE